MKAAVQEPGRPVRIHPGQAQGARAARSKDDDQESATGFYPHAGLLSTFQYLRRYPTTETNRNRLRARMYYLHFLGVDVLELAARVVGRRGGHGEVPDPDDAGVGVRGLPQDARPGGRAVSRTTTTSRASTGGARAAGSRTCSPPGFEGETCRPTSAGGRCSGSASGPRRTRASPSPWSSTSTTS